MMTRADSPGVVDAPATAPHTSPKKPRPRSVSPSKIPRDTESLSQPPNKDGDSKEGPEAATESPHTANGDRSKTTDTVARNEVEEDQGARGDADEDHDMNSAGADRDAREDNGSDAEGEGDGEEPRGHKTKEKRDQGPTGPDGIPSSSTGAGLKTRGKVVIDREKLPMLTIFPALRSSTSPRNFLLVHTISSRRDATLREIAFLITEARPQIAARAIRLSFRTVYQQEIHSVTSISGAVRYFTRDIGTVTNFRKFTDDDKTLEDARFIVGDSLDVAVFEVQEFASGGNGPDRERPGSGSGHIGVQGLGGAGAGGLGFEVNSGPGGIASGPRRISRDFLHGNRFNPMASGDRGHRDGRGDTTIRGRGMGIVGSASFAEREERGERERGGRGYMDRDERDRGGGGDRLRERRGRGEWERMDRDRDRGFRSRDGDGGFGRSRMW
ncbi:hypothetical protein HK102_006601 [Quaeritorhiza haematococci]|nr:hypothetical protein HK102_006601 [Quaeritorhiza haematococci]